MEEPTEDNYSDLFLKDSVKYGLYKKFTRKDIDNADTYCNMHEDRFFGNRDIYNLCKIFEKNLTQLSTIMQKEPDRKQHCRYLRFWINDEIRKKLISLGKSKHNINSIFIALFSVSSMLVGGSSEIQCIYNYDKDITMNMWKEWKDLYDYIINEDEIKRKINSNEQLC